MDLILKSDILKILSILYNIFSLSIISSFDTFPLSSTGCRTSPLSSHRIEQLPWIPHANTSWHHRHHASNLISFTKPHHCCHQHAPSHTKLQLPSIAWPPFSTLNRLPFNREPPPETTLAASSNPLRLPLSCAQPRTIIVNHHERT